MRTILYRILGNDLPPRHSETQTRDNLMFMLENEPEFCEKRFVLNRIVDKAKLAALRDVLMRSGYNFSEIPFSIGEYRQCQNMVERIQYLTNVNRARNYCVVDGFEKGADIVLPFDGGSMFRQDGWDQFEENARYNADDPYFVLGQWRVDSYDQFLDPEVLPSLQETYVFGEEQIVGLREPTIAFGRNHDKRFNEDLRYGQVDKVELVWKIGIPGVWDRWEPKLRQWALADRSEAFGTVKLVGWVARLPSGNAEADKNNHIRGHIRAQSIQKLVEFANSVGVSR